MGKSNSNNSAPSIRCRYSRGLELAVIGDDVAEKSQFVLNNNHSLKWSHIITQKDNSASSLTQQSACRYIDLLFNITLIPSHQVFAFPRKAVDLARSRT
jgi:hypothetical protein